MPAFYLRRGRAGNRSSAVAPVTWIQAGAWRRGERGDVHERHVPPKNCEVVPDDGRNHSQGRPQVAFPVSEVPHTPDSTPPGGGRESTSANESGRACGTHLRQGGDRRRSRRLGRPFCLARVVTTIDSFDDFREGYRAEKRADGQVRRNEERSLKPNGSGPCARDET